MKTKTYWFGLNWKNFVRFHINEINIEYARLRLFELLDGISIQNRTFLDVGCGSGIHSLAALQLGASRILSIDVDENSVQTCKLVREKFAPGSDRIWTILELSALDNAAMESLGKFDIVYAWGSLHHSGDVWSGITNSLERVQIEGYLVLALYSKNVVPEPSHDFWLEKKRIYVESGFWTRKRMELWYIWRFLLGKDLRKLPLVINRFTSYRQDRGMSLLVDIRDWLGGWPMEFTLDEEVVQFVETRGFTCLRKNTGKANTEYVFKKI